MAVIVVGGSGRGVGKTALVCGLIAALPEFGWAAVKVTSHAYGQRETIWEETEPGPGTDTSRYLAAGAQRALLVTAGEDELALRLGELRERLEPGAHVMYESNSVLRHLTPDICLGVMSGGGSEAKPSFREAFDHADALVSEVGLMSLVAGGKRTFRLDRLDSISDEMGNWLRQRLPHG